MSDQTNPTTADVDVILANWHMQQQQLDPIRDHADEAINHAEAALAQLYNAAEQSGDDTAKTAIMAAWGRAQQLHSGLATTHAALAGASATMQTLADQRNAIASELESLLEAIDDGNYTDDRLADFVQAVEEWTTEAHMYYLEESVHEQVYQEIHDNFRGYGLSYTDAFHAQDILLGNVKLDPDQLELLKTLLDSRWLQYGDRDQAQEDQG